MNDSLGKPLINRASQSFYPPGSTFKLMNALIAQQEGVLNGTTTYPCAMGFPLNKGMPGCHEHGSPLNLDGAISQSCNSYFSYVFKSILDNKNTMAKIKKDLKHGESTFKVLVLAYELVLTYHLMREGVYQL